MVPNYREFTMCYLLLGIEKCYVNFYNFSLSLGSFFCGSKAIVCIFGQYSPIVIIVIYDTKYC